MSKINDILEELDTIYKRLEALEKRLDSFEPDYAKRDDSLECWAADMIRHLTTNLVQDGSCHDKPDYSNLTLPALLLMARNPNSDLAEIEKEMARRIWGRDRDIDESSNEL